MLKRLQDLASQSAPAVLIHKEKDRLNRLYPNCPTSFPASDKLENVSEFYQTARLADFRATLMFVLHKASTLAEAQDQAKATLLRWQGK